MPNQYKNKIIYGNETLVDLTADTVTANTMVMGMTAHDASGAPITGTLDSKQAENNGTDLSLVTTGEKYVWNNKTDNLGTITSITAGVGLTGGTITTSGTIKAALINETALINAATDATEIADRVYPVRVDSNGKLAVNVPWTNTQTITGVKGDAENSYRTGNINITPANIGSPAIDGTGATGTWGISISGNAETATSSSYVHCRQSFAKGTNPSSTQYYIIARNLQTGSGIQIADRIGGYIESALTADGDTTLALRSYCFESGSTANNYIIIRIDKDGTKSYEVSAPAAFRTAIGALATEGGTMTGLLTNTSDIVIKQTAVDGTSSTNNISETKYKSYAFYDKNNNWTGAFRQAAYTDGSFSMQIYVRNYLTSSSSWVDKNVLSYRYYKNGTVAYSVSDAAAFRSGIGALATSAGVDSILTNNLYMNVAGTWSGSLRFGTRAGVGTEYTTIAQNDWGILYYAVPAKVNADNTYQTARFLFRQYSPTSNRTRTSYYDEYWLPAATLDKTSNNYYTILTTKNVVTPAQGGTGQTSIANIQAGKDADGNTISSTYLKLSGGTMTGSIYMGQSGASSAAKSIWWKTANATEMYLRPYNNKLQFVINGHGTLDFNSDDTISVYSPQNWRNALGASSGTWPISLGGTGATTAKAARTNLEAATDIYIPSSVTTLSAAFPYFDKIPTNHSATIFVVSSTLASALSNGKIGAAIKGVVNRSAEGTFDFMTTNVVSGKGLARIHTWRIAGYTSASVTSLTFNGVYKYDGTAI